MIIDCLNKGKTGIIVFHTQTRSCRAVEDTILCRSLTIVSILTSHVRFFVLLVIFELSAIDGEGFPTKSMALSSNITKRTKNLTSLVSIETLVRDIIGYRSIMLYLL